jgi:hypothetical protein
VDSNPSTPKKKQPNTTCNVLYDCTYTIINGGINSLKGKMKETEKVVSGSQGPGAWGRAD